MESRIVDKTQWLYRVIAMAFAHFTLATRDVDKSRDFFVATLGWNPIVRPGNIGRKACWLSIAPGQEAHFVEVENFEPTLLEREFGRHIAISHPIDQFDNLKERLVQHGAELIEPERPTPFSRFFFRDPNGYIFEIVEAGHASET